MCEYLRLLLLVALLNLNNIKEWPFGQIIDYVPFSGTLIVGNRLNVLIRQTIDFIDIN